MTATATVMNLLATGAAFGVVAIFQFGWGLHLPAGWPWSRGTTKMPAAAHEIASFLP